jgi:glycerol-3-phosphate dehydrogenase (NAD(P)+)
MQSETQPEIDFASPSEPLSIGIIGAGAIGSALGELAAAANGREVRYWDTDRAKCTAASLAELVAASDVLLICVSTVYLESVAAEIGAALPEGRRVLVLTVAKGVSTGLENAALILGRAAAGRFDFGVFYGPMLAAEVAAQGRLAAVAAVSDPSWFGCLDGAFGEASRVVYSDNPRSVALCGVLKNIYAVALGLASGLGWGYNDRGRLLVEIMAEFRDLLVVLGGDAADADGLAGLGDLIATGSSELSFNFRAGMTLADGEPPKGEGINSLNELDSVADLDLEDYIVINILSGIAFKGLEPSALWQTVVG